MKIYLDNCIFQELKKEEQKRLLDSIIKSKGEYIYCFSEAHIMDLSRDKTDEKFSDMDFMQMIVDDNCFYYEKQIMFEYITPIRYYNRFDWTETSSANDIITNIANDEVFGSLFKSLFGMFETIPLNFKELIHQNQLADNMPDSMKNIFNVSNVYEWMLALTNYSDKLTEEQKIFKEQLQYLHNSKLDKEVYKAMGIEGYNGKITDRGRFRESYVKYFFKNTKGKYRYDLFSDMYCGLETFCFVQGKPRKQKMRNMIEDSHHAFFGGFCDIVVSKDEDFINKTKFMYNLHEIQTRVYTITEFEQYLDKNIQSSKKSFFDLLKEIKNENAKWSYLKDDSQATFRKLDNTYLGYFNMLIHSNEAIYFTKDNTTFMEGTLIKEIKFCINRLSEELGNDIYLKGKWIDGELKKNEEKKWHGRTWALGENTMVDLKFSDRLYIIIYSSEKN
jgi:hypothetical protein